MTLYRITRPNLESQVARVQRRAFCHFADSAERAAELPTPEVGAVSVIGTTFQYWNGSAWVALITGVDQSYVDARIPKQWSATGIALSGAAVSTATTMVTVNVPAQPIAGIICAFAVLRFDRSVAADFHQVDVTDATTVLARFYQGGSLVQNNVALSGSVSLPASTARTVTTTLQRISGTGTVTTFGTYQSNHLDVMWIPA